MENQSSQKIVEELRENIKSIWLHRSGNEVHAGIQDVIDFKYSKIKPLIKKKIKIGNDAWRFMIHLPPGLSYGDFKRLEQLFIDATGGSVEISKHGKQEVIMEVLGEELKTFYPYSLFNYKEYPDMYLPFPIGMSAKGLIVRDLTEYPHFFIGGETGFGKTVQLHAIVNAIKLSRPETFITIVDPKSTEFSYLEDKALVIDEMSNVGILFRKLNMLMDERKKLLKSAKCNKIQKYLKNGYEMNFIVLAIDEWADLPEDAQEDLWRLLRMGRFVGIHVLACTQRPSSKIFEKFGDMKAMFYGRMSYVVADAINSRMILDCDDAAYLPAIKGRAIYKCGLEKLEVQSLFLDPDEAIKLYDRISYKVVTPLVSLEQPQKRLPPR